MRDLRQGLARASASELKVSADGWSRNAPCVKRLLRDGHAVTASYRDGGGRDRALAELGEQTRLTFVR